MGKVAIYPTYSKAKAGEGYEYEPTSVSAVRIVGRMGTLIGSLDRKIGRLLGTDTRNALRYFTNEFPAFFRYIHLAHTHLCIILCPLEYLRGQTCVQKTV